MKCKFLLLFSLAAVLGASAVEIPSGALAPTTLVRSQCKGHGSRMTTGENMTARVSYVDHVLTLTVSDMIEQCGAMFASYCKTDIPGELHFVVWDDCPKDLYTDCVCPFDVECTYKGILDGYYDIFLEAPNGHVYMKGCVCLSSGTLFDLSEADSVANVCADSTNSLSISADGTLRIAATGPVAVTVFDASGTERGSFTVEAPAELSLASLPRGIYIVKADVSGHTEKIKFTR